MKFIKSSVLILGMALTFTGCGDLFGKKVVKRAMESSQFQASCELNVDRFQHIMHENISADIKCLEENLNLFIELVESNRPGYLSRVAFEAYLINNEPDVTPEVVKAIKSVFEINYLLRGEDPNFISKQNVKDIINFALVFNQEAAKNFGPIFENETEVPYARHQYDRDRLSKSIRLVAVPLLKIFKPNRGDVVHKLNIINLLESFTTPETVEVIEKVKKVLFAKKVILGGEPDILTHHELERIIFHSDKLALIALDLVRYKYIDNLNQESLLYMLKEDVEGLHDIIFGKESDQRDSELLFSIDEAMEAVKTFVTEEDFDIEKFRTLILEGKKLVMGGDEQFVTGLDLRNLFNHGQSLLLKGTFFHRIYDKHRAQLDGPKPVTINFDDDRATYPKFQEELTDFERIVKKYRFFRGEFISAYFSTAHRRNADGVFEVAMWEYILKIIFQNYGSKSDGLGGWSMSDKQVKALIKKFENELIDLDIILPQMASNTADNISLLGSLFQFQSDDNALLDVNEAAEFAVSLVTAMDKSKEMMNFYREKNCTFDQFDRIEPGCFRVNFFQGICQNYRQYYPRLFEYYGLSQKCEELETNSDVMAFLDTSIKASRICNNYTNGDKEEIYYSEGDVMALMMVMMHIEITIIRWDKNENNIMDSNEVDKAYKIYSPALDGFLEGKGIVKMFKKQIYKYLVKFEQVPDETSFKSIWRFIRFLLSFSYDAPAERKTIASILYQIGLQNAKLPTSVDFDCNLMRDPTNIPRETRMRGNALNSNSTDYSYLLEQYLHLVNP